MSMGSQIAAFCKDVAENEIFWTIQFEDENILKWVDEDGTEVLPFWSTQSRAEKALERIEPAESNYIAYITLDDFLTGWLEEISNIGVRIGPNWSGDNLTGTTFSPEELISRIKKYGNSGSKNT
jgi:hypothetical protein